MRFFIYQGSLCFEPEVDSDINWRYTTWEMFRNKNFHASTHSMTCAEAEQLGKLDLLNTPEKAEFINRENAKG